MKKILSVISAVLAFLLILSPIILLLCTTVFLPSQFSNTFVGALDDKYERLSSIEEPKVVVIGGSSVAFGLDSEKMEELLDIAADQNFAPVVDDRDSFVGIVTRSDIIKYFSRENDNSGVHGIA